MFWTVHNPLWHILSLSQGNLAGTTSSSVREEYSYMKANTFVLFSTKVFPFILISLSVVLKINIHINEKKCTGDAWANKIIWTKFFFFLKQLSVLQIFIYVLHNCVNNCCIATTYKLMAKPHICNIYTILCPERIGIFFTVHVPNLKRQCIWNILMSAPCKNWGTVDPTRGMGLHFGWELTRAGAIIHLDVIAPLVGSPIILSFEYFLSQTPWELLLKCIKKCKCFANYTISSCPDKTFTKCCKISFP